MLVAMSLATRLRLTAELAGLFALVIVVVGSIPPLRAVLVG